MKKIFYLFVICIVGFVNDCYSAGIDTTNVLVLYFDGAALQFKKSYSSSGTPYLVHQVPIRYNYTQLKILIEGKEQMDPTKFKTEVYYMGKNCDSLGKELFPGKSYTVLIDSNFNDMVDTAETLDTIASRLSFVFVYGNDSLKICTEPAEDLQQGTNESTGIIDLCENPHFYSSYYLQPQTTLKNQNPFYVIEQDFSSLNNGMEIYKYTPIVSGSTWSYTIEPTRTLRVGYNATAIFKFYDSEFSKISHALSFKDLNQEDQKIFESVLDNVTNKIVDTETIQDIVSLPTSEAYLKFVNVLVSDLTLFRNDIFNHNPATIRVTNALRVVKENIKNCIPGLENVTPSTLGAFLTKGGDDPAFLAQLNEAVQLLYTLENYSAYKPPSFQIKNADLLESNVSYFIGNEATSSYTREFSSPILGGLKLDFSTGFILSTLVDRTYVIKNSPSVVRVIKDENGEETEETIDMKRIEVEKQSKYRLGFGVLSHFYPRLSECISLAFTTGFMVKDDLAVQFPIGGSVLIGRKPRLSLSVGRMVGERSELSSRYQLNTDVEASTLTNITEDKLTVKRYKTGWFFAFSYNFGGVNVGQ